MHRVCGEFNIRFPFSALSSFVDFVICLIYRTLSCTTALMSLMKVHKGIYGIIMYIARHCYIVIILRVSGLSSFISYASGSLDIIFHASGLVPPPPLNRLRQSPPPLPS